MLDEATWKTRLDDGAKELGVELDRVAARHALALRLHAARAQRAREPHLHRVARGHPHAAHARQPVGGAASRRGAAHHRRGHGRRFSGNSAGRGLSRSGSSRSSTARRRRSASSRRASRRSTSATCRRWRRAPRVIRARRNSTWWCCARWARSPMLYITPAQLLGAARPPARHEGARARRRSPRAAARLARRGDPPARAGTRCRAPSCRRFTSVAPRRPRRERAPDKAKQPRRRAVIIRWP